MPPRDLSDEIDSGCRIVLFHSALGLRPSVLRWADELRARGHLVQTPDLYDGETFDTIQEGLRKVDAIGGIAALMQRSLRAVEGLPNDVVYAGFSNGGGSALYLALNRPGARGVVLMHAALPVQAFGVDVWPATVPLQIHYAIDDPFRDQGAIDALTASAREAGVFWEQWDYDVSGHLFADGDLADFDQAAADLMLRRMTDFLERRTPRER